MLQNGLGLWVVVQLPTVKEKIDLFSHSSVCELLLYLSDTKFVHYLYNCECQCIVHVHVHVHVVCWFSGQRLPIPGTG